MDQEWAANSFNYLLVLFIYRAIENRFVLRQRFLLARSFYVFLCCFLNSLAKCFFKVGVLCKLAISVKQKKKEVVKRSCQTFTLFACFAHFFFQKFVSKTTVKLVDKENIFTIVFTIYFLFIVYIEHFIS